MSDSSDTADEKIESIVQKLKAEKEASTSDDEELKDILNEPIVISSDNESVTSAETLPPATSLMINSFLMNSDEWENALYQTNSIEFDPDLQEVDLSALNPAELLPLSSETNNLLNLHHEIPSEDVIDSDETNIDETVAFYSDDEPPKKQKKYSKGTETNLNSFHNKFVLESSPSEDSEAEDIPNLIDDNETNHAIEDNLNVYRSVAAQQDDEELETLKRFNLIISGF